MDEIKKIGRDVVSRFIVLIKWLVFAGITGAVLGAIGAIFAKSIAFVSAFRVDNPQMLYLLPLAGVIIVAMYEKGKVKGDGGTNLVLESIHSAKEIPFRMAPMIFIATVLTHAFGGSAGREGAALQLGGSLGTFFGKIFRINEKEKKIMIMVGMSAVFSALFGTPLAATIFAMEVVTVGIMHYSALMPCSVAALTANYVAKLFGEAGEHFNISDIPAFSMLNGGKVILLAFLCAGLSIIFCAVLHKAEKLYKECYSNPYFRIVAGAIFVIALSKILNTTDYLGSGMNIIERAIEGHVFWAAFILKIIFTALTLGAGFKGGEIVPALFTGATFGCLFGQLIGLSPSLCAACGMVALFSGVTNSPIASLVLAFEMFGFEAMPYYLLAIAVGYMYSGYTGLYHGQKIIYAKDKPEYINIQTGEKL